jgi:hypothetical protein
MGTVGSKSGPGLDFLFSRWRAKNHKPHKKQPNAISAATSKLFEPSEVMEVQWRCRRNTTAQVNRDSKTNKKGWPKIVGLRSSMLPTKGMIFTKMRNGSRWSLEREREREVERRRKNDKNAV